MVSKVYLDHGELITEENFVSLIKDPQFQELYIKLHVEEEGPISQARFFRRLKAWTEYNPHDKSEVTIDRLNFVDLLESVTYLVCKENDIALNQLSTILNTRGVPKKLFNVLSQEKSECSLESLMTFVLESSKSKTIDSPTLEKLQIAFIKNFGRDKSEVNFEEFKRMIPSKDEFFSKRIFQVFDCDRSGTISIAEFCENIHEFSKEDDQSKLAFLFHIYDVNEDGKLYKENFQSVIEACVKESGIKLQEEKVSKLAEVLFEDGLQEGCSYMTLDCFKKQILKQDGLLENLVVMLHNWLLPQDENSSQGKSMKNILSKEKPRYLSMEYFYSNRSLVLAIAALIVLILIITLERLIYFSHMTMLSGFTPNIFYMLSRAAGKNILALSIIVIMLVLRHSITILRNYGLGRVLPLDNNIYLHKIVGSLIFMLGVIHSVCHFSNFAVNIQPDPVKYLQLTYKYWENHFGKGNVFSQYNLPDGCYLANWKETSKCPHNSLEIPPSVNQDYIFNDGNFTCQLCQPGFSAWSYSDWILSLKPGLFGLVGGVANPTGVGLLAIMIIMFICSLPFVRRTGHFEVFYFTHYLYVLYYVLLILHAPEFWKWFLPVGIIWLGERIFRVAHMFAGKGRTVIEEGIVLPSKVTNLVIKRPSGFNFNPGDWVFVNIPRYFTVFTLQQIS